MSVRVSDAVYKHSRAELGARLVLLAIADTADPDGVAWCDQTTIAAMQRLAVSTVKRSIVELVALGELEIRTAQRGRRRINVYRVMLPGLSEVNYDRLPFALKEPFTTSQSDTSSEITPEATRSQSEKDEVSSSASTRSQSASRVKEDPPYDPSLDPPLELPIAARPDAAEPPRVTLIEKRNLAHDAIAEECSIASVSDRHREIGTALNGTKSRPGIRAILWAEAVDDQHLVADPAIFGGGEPWERALATEVRVRATQYRQRLPAGTLLTPTALWKWWADLPGMARLDGNVSIQEILAMTGGR